MKLRKLLLETSVAVRATDPFWRALGPSQRNLIKDVVRLIAVGRRRTAQKKKRGSSLEMTPILFNPKMFAKYDPTQEIIFPPELIMNSSTYLESMHLSGPKTTFFRVTSLGELLAIKNIHKDAAIVVGNSKIGVDINIHHKRYPKIIHPVGIPEMTELRISDSFFEIGAAASISDIESFIKEKIKEIPESKSKVLFSLSGMLKYFADRQIKNVASVAGNIMSGFSKSDFNTIFVASKALLVFHSLGKYSLPKKKKTFQFCFDFK
ncbi:hypothetical protein Avbf_02444 [Armadillidium vulgare]|nr:hypothetical protein Avbf_02444 [Armadillidium vulgare]